jgi:hypothetical protein
MYNSEINTKKPKYTKKTLLEYLNELMRRNTEEIQYNVPELFIDEGEK